MNTIAVALFRSCDNCGKSDVPHDEFLCKGCKADKKQHDRIQSASDRKLAKAVKNDTRLDPSLMTPEDARAEYTKIRNRWSNPSGGLVAKQDDITENFTGWYVDAERCQKLRARFMGDA